MHWVPTMYQAHASFNKHLLRAHCIQSFWQAFLHTPFSLSLSSLGSFSSSAYCIADPELDSKQFRRGSSLHKACGLVGEPTVNEAGLPTQAFPGSKGHPPPFSPEPNGGRRTLNTGGWWHVDKNYLVVQKKWGPPLHRRVRKILLFFKRNDAFLKNYFIYLFLAVLGLCCCAWAFSSWCEQGLLFVAVRGLLIAVAFLVVERGL